MENGKLKVWLPAIRAGSGSDVFTLRLAQALDRCGMAAQISWFPLRYEIMPFWLRRIPAPANTDIIFANSWNGFAFKRPGLPLVVTLHHAEFGVRNSHLSWVQTLYRHALIRQYETWSFRAADAITAVSHFAADSLNETAYTDKTAVIHHWIDVEKFRPARENIPQHKPFRLLFVGKPSFLKGADLLPKIMCRLGGDFHLAIAGRLSSEHAAHRSGNISFLGWLEEEQLISAYQDCDALLFPSRSEGFGYTALEAMACGKPVITSNATALPEIVAHGETGILCHTGDAEAFAAACRRIADDTDFTRSMGAAGRRRAIEEFSETKAIADYLGLINRLVHPNK